MVTDFTFNQGSLLKPAHLADPALYGGICFAMVLDWCTKMKSGVAMAPGADFYRQTSSQRAYQMTWEDLIKPHMAAGAYAQFYGAAEPPTYRFFKQSIERSGWACQRLEYSSVEAARAGMQQVQGVALVGLFGSENGSNWGHATAMGHLGKWTFFDPNQGQFSLPSSTPAEIAAQEIMLKLDPLYAPATVKNCVLYLVN